MIVAEEEFIPGLRFAQAPTDMPAVMAFLVEQMAGQPDFFWGALVDVAFDEATGSARLKLDDINCYAGDDRLRDLESVAPWLIPLDVYEQGQECLAQLLAHCNGRPMFSLLASEKPLNRLASIWHPLHWVHTTEGKPMLLRFADTRVLPTLPGILTPPQWAALTRPLAHWLYIDRDGRAVTVELPAPDSPAAARIEFTDEQLTAMIAACEPDAAFDLVMQHTPGLIPSDAPAASIHAGLRQIFDLAAEHGVEPWPDKMALAMAELLTQGKIRDRPELKELLQAGAWEAGKLGERLQPLLMPHGA